MLTKLHSARFVFAATAFVLSLTAHASLIDNGNTTIDTTTGREWLDLTLTQGQSYFDIALGYGDYVSAGYRLATASEVCGLWSSYGDVLNGCGGATSAQGNIALASGNNLLSLLGAAPFGGASIGFYDDGDVSDGVGVGCLSINNVGCTSFELGDPVVPGWLTNGPNYVSMLYSNPGVGNYLVRVMTVPEPNSLALFAAAVPLLLFMRRLRCRTEIKGTLPFDCDDE
jgi:hypothetical protein